MPSARSQWIGTLVVVVLVLVGIAARSYHKGSETNERNQLAAKREARYCRDYVTVGPLQVIRIADGDIDYGTKYALFAEVSNAGPGRVDSITLIYDLSDGFRACDDSEYLGYKFVILGTYGTSEEYGLPGSSIRVGDVVTVRLEPELVDKQGDFGPAHCTLSSVEVTLAAELVDSE